MSLVIIICTMHILVIVSHSKASALCILQRQSWMNAKCKSQRRYFIKFSYWSQLLHNAKNHLTSMYLNSLLRVSTPTLTPTPFASIWNFIMSTVNIDIIRIHIYAIIPGTQCLGYMRSRHNFWWNPSFWILLNCDIHYNPWRTLNWIERLQSS